MLSARFISRWVVAFVFTQVVEVPIYRRTLHPSFLAAFGASSLTHPLVWLFLGSHVLRAPWPVQIAIAELFAWWAEAAYFRFFFGCTSALVWTLVANAASFALGLVSRALLGWP